jgi:transcriptional regulator with XRE-family HTH domain
MKVDAEERAEIAETMRKCLEQSALTQADFASYLGTSAPRLSTYLSGKTIPSASIYLRALRIGRALELAHNRGLMTPDSAIDAVNRALSDGDQDFALRMILQARDDLRASSVETAEIGPAWSGRAKRIEDERFDTLFRAIIAHEFGERVPSWAADAELAEDWIFEDPFRSAEAIRAQTPEWLARAHIYIAERGLMTA